MRTLLEYALANAAAATALALVALAVGFVVRRPAVRNALWVLVLVRLVLPPVWTVPLPVPIEQPVEIASTVADPIPPAPEPTPIEDEPLVFDHQGEEVPVATDVAEPAAVAPAVEEAPASFPTYAVIGGVWAAGCGFVFARAAWRVGRFRRALRDARPAPEAIRQQAATLATAMGLRRCPMVLVVPGRVSPALWMPGLFPRQAKVLLPAGLVSVLDDGQRAAVLAHELAHLRRGDPWVRWLEVLVGGLYWWFPLVAWFRRHLRASEEACCDLWVVAALGGRRAYATALVETAAFLGGPSPVASPVLASGAGPVLDLQRRVTMIMQATWPARLTRFGLATVLGVGVAGLSFGPALAQPPERDRDRGRGEDRKDPPKDRERERPKDGDRDRPRDERPRDGDRRPDAPREKASEAEIQRAREAAEKARKEAREAIQRMQEAEERLAKAEGRPARKFPDGMGGFGQGGFGGPGGFGGFGPGGGGGFPGGFGGGGAGRPVPGKEVERPRDGDRRPSIEPGEERRPVPRPEGRPDVRPEGRGGPAGGEFRELQQQIEELRRALEQMRQEMRRGGERRSEPAKDRPSM
jgi:bla regulator protein blaR1